MILHVCVCVSRYFSQQSALGRRRQPDDVDSEADEVSDDEFDAFLGKLTADFDYIMQLQTDVNVDQRINTFVVFLETFQFQNS